ASYRVYYGTTEHPCPGGRLVTAAAPKVRLPPDQPLKVRLTGLRMGTLYYVAVTAVNSQGGESPCTPTASARARAAEQKGPSWPPAARPPWRPIVRSARSGSCCAISASAA